MELGMNVMPLEAGGTFGFLPWKTLYAGFLNFRTLHWNVDVVMTPRHRPFLPWTANTYSATQTIPCFYWTRMFFTVFKIPRHRDLTLGRFSPDWFQYYPHIFLGIFSLQVCQSKFCVHLSVLTLCYTSRQSHFLDQMKVTISILRYKLLHLSLCNSLNEWKVDWRCLRTKSWVEFPDLWETECHIVTSEVKVALFQTTCDQDRQREWSR